jgi:hypothetical protein
MDLPGVFPLAKKHKIDTVQVMKGFERHSSRFTPLLRGVIVRDQDYPSLL